ncbi:reverse transcriptase domain-containing protein, partial [Streptococcus dysgalactiae]|uniref:reverse transcriptase domain-containing protein n=1 Tax=Streptococcus dysgalactiae TaxID=1334 RepID=UPI001EF1C81C
MSGDEVIEVPQAFTIKDIPIKATKSVSRLAKRWAHLSDIPFEEIEEEEVVLLIGCDIPEAHWSLEQRVSGRKQPYAVKTLLGWVLFGPLGGYDRRQRNINCLCADNSDIAMQIKTLYNQEFEDVSNPKTSYSVEERQAVDIVKEGAKLRGIHYEVPLPWKIYHAKMPDNKRLAEKRLHQLAKRLLRDTELFEKYKTVIQRHLDKGYLKPYEPITNRVLSSPRWYVPHHAVFNPKKPNKLRVVFDCAAKFNQISLNDCLLKGPDLTSSLIIVLMRFRSKRIAISADIEEVFFQVGVSEAQRDALRSLWWPEHDLTELPIEYRMTVHPFGAVSSPFCANYALQTTASEHSHLFPEAVTTSVYQHFYVDDYLDSFDDDRMAVQHAAELTKLLAESGFRLTKWMANSQEIQQAETDILWLVQSNEFPEEFSSFADKNRARSSRRRTALSRLNPVLMNKLLRVGGRLSNPTIPLEMKHPIILPKNHHVSKLIAWYYHQNEDHVRSNHVISRIWTRFSVVLGTSSVKDAISWCAVRERIKSVRKQQMMLWLPGCYPFTQVALDYVRLIG